MGGWRRRGGRLFVLLYHEVGTQRSEFLEEQELIVSPELFEFQVDEIRRRFPVVSAEVLLNGSWPAEDSVLLTFDDAWPGALREGAAILHRRGLPAVFFLNWGDLEEGWSWSALNSFLARDDAGYRRRLEAQAPGAVPSHMGHLRATPELLDAHRREHPIDEARFAQYMGPHATIDLVRASAAAHPDLTFGNHLFRHYNAARLSSTELARAYLDNARALAALPRALPLFAFPFGIPNATFTRRTVALIRQLGARVLFSGFARANRHEEDGILHRISLGPRHDTRERVLRRVALSGVRPLVKRGLAVLGVRRFQGALAAETAT